MTTIDDMARADARGPGGTPADDSRETALARLVLRFTDWAEHWFPDPYIFVALTVAVVAVAALLNGAPPATVARSFGDGFWSLIPLRSSSPAMWSPARSRPPGSSMDLLPCRGPDAPPSP